VLFVRVKDRKQLLQADPIQELLDFSVTADQRQPSKLDYSGQRRRFRQNRIRD
jgi:hypothetical protein